MQTTPGSDMGMCGYADRQVLDIGILGYWDIRILGYGICEYADRQIKESQTAIARILAVFFE
jgi:hypothetical protein